MIGVPLTLVISDKPDPERDALAAVWASTVGPVLRLGRFWEPPPVDVSSVRLYGADTFCLVLAQKLGINLVSPADDLIFSAPSRFLRRKISRKTLKNAQNLEYPTFVKPLVPKQFRAAVYQSPSTLLKECDGLELATEILVSDPVNVVAEARFFVCSSTICSYALYEGRGELERAVSMVEELISEINLPETVVIDVGTSNEKDWFVIEFNASWGSGLNGCDPLSVVPCIRAAVST